MSRGKTSDCEGNSTKRLCISRYWMFEKDKGGVTLGLKGCWQDSQNGKGAGGQRDNAFGCVGGMKRALAMFTKRNKSWRVERNRVRVSERDGDGKGVGEVHKMEREPAGREPTRSGAWEG